VFAFTAEVTAAVCVFVFALMNAASDVEAANTVLLVFAFTKEAIDDEAASV
jgi:hypothetical protein